MIYFSLMYTRAAMHSQTDLLVMRELSMSPASSTGRVKNPAVHGGLVAGADVGSQEQELAKVGQLKIQFRRRSADLLPA